MTAAFVMLVCSIVGFGIAVLALANVDGRNVRARRTYHRDHEPIEADNRTSLWQRLLVGYENDLAGPAERRK